MTKAYRFLLASIVIIIGIAPLVSQIESVIFKGYNAIGYLVVNYIEIGLFSLGVWGGAKTCRT